MDDAPPDIQVRITTPEGEASVVLLRGAVVRAGGTWRWALGLPADALSAYIRERGWTATQRRAPPVLVLEG